MPRLYNRDIKIWKNYKNVTASSYILFVHEPIYIGRCKKFILEWIFSSPYQLVEHEQ